MKIFLNEITDQETEFDFSEDEKWVTDAISQLDEAAHPQTRPVDAQLKINKIDEVVVINGNIKTHVQLLCSRCAASYTLPCDHSFTSLYCKDASMAGIAHLKESGEPAGQNQGHARHAHDILNDEKDLDITYIADDCIDLAEVLAEQLRLQLPIQPLCQENCKGICPQCGADFNVGRCACSKIMSDDHPFAALRNLNVKT